MPFYKRDEETNKVSITTPTTNSILERAKNLELDKQSNRSYVEMLNDPEVIAAAQRFVRDRLGQDDLSEKEAVDEFMEHFRSFNVNELTAAGDYGYVSAAAADAEKRRDDRAVQRLADYRLLYQTFSDLPSFSGGYGETFEDYAKGLITAPSTYVGLVLPGIGKGSGLATTQAAKAGVASTLRQALRKPVSTAVSGMAARPITTTAAVEGVAGSLQNIAAQKTEMEADLRKDYRSSETALAFGLSAAMPVGLGVLGAKSGAKRIIERNTVDLVQEADKAILEANEKSAKKADKLLSENKEIAGEIRGVLRSLDPEKVEAGKAVRKDIEEVEDLSPDFTIALDPERTKRIFAATVEIMKESGEGLRSGERITEGIARVIRDKDNGDEFAKEVMDKYNITSDDFANLFMADVSEAARTLQAAGTASKIFQRLSDVAATDVFGLDKQLQEKALAVGKKLQDGDARAAIQKADALQGEVKKGLVSRLDDTRRAFMTSQTATTVRNVASGYARVGIDVLTKAVDRGISASVAKLTGKKVELAPNEDILGIVYGLINKKEADAVKTIFEQGFSLQATKLFRELQDIGDATGRSTNRVGALESISRELNALNTFSDNMFKQAAFIGSLKRQLNEAYTRARRAGEDVNIDDYKLTEIIKNGKFNQTFGIVKGKGAKKTYMPQDALKKAIDESLYFTYQRTPDNPVAKGIINGIHSAPFLTTSLIPFPRFVMNAMRFTYEYSPFYLVEGGTEFYKTLTGKAGATGNYEDISKALVGTGILFGAAGFRMTENAGEKWYEYKMDNGQTFDMRPFFPAAPFLFFGDILAKAMQGEDMSLVTKNVTMDALQALTGTQFKAGFGFYALDSMFRDLSQATDPTYEGVIGQKADTILLNGMTNIINTFTIPLTAGQDLYNTFLAPDDERLVRQTKTSDVMSLIINKTLSRVPGNYAIEEYLAEKFGTTAPEIYASPTRKEPLRRQIPLTRQLTGALLQERRNFFEQEVERLKITRSQVARRTGIPEADQLIGTLFGEHANEFIVPTLQNSKRYKEGDSEYQREFLLSLIGEYKQDVMHSVRAISYLRGPENYGFDPMARADFVALKSRAKRKAIQEYHETYGEPTEDRPYDFSTLLALGKKYQKIPVR